jgi:hypothetical protein
MKWSMVSKKKNRAFRTCGIGNKNNFRRCDPRFIGRTIFEGYDTPLARLYPSRYDGCFMTALCNCGHQLPSWIIHQKQRNQFQAWSVSNTVQSWTSSPVCAFNKLCTQLISSTPSDWNQTPRNKPRGVGPDFSTWKSLKCTQRVRYWGVTPGHSDTLYLWFVLNFLPSTRRSV